MDNRPQNPPTGGMSLDDIDFVLFRHKWKIILLFAAGVLAAATIYRTKPPDYQSTAELMIKYVVDNTSPGPAENDAHMQSTDPQGQTIINTEIVILTSLDVSKKVAEDIGPEKILAKLGGGNDLMQAAGFINGRLHVTPLPKSSVIEVDFKHPDWEMVQPILTQIISEYKKQHIEVHQPNGNYSDFFTTKIYELTNDLARIDTELRSARTNAGVISTDDAAKEYAKALDKTGQAIREAEADLATRTFLFNEMTRFSFGKAGTTNANTNLSSKPEPPIPAVVTEQYARICRRLIALRASDEELTKQGYKDQSTLVANNRMEIKQAEAQKQMLEEQNPGLKLTDSQVFSPKIPPQPGQTQSTDMSASLPLQAIQIAALQRQIDVLKSQLKDLTSRAEMVADLQPQVLELERQRKQVQDSLDFYTKSRDTARINDTLGAGKAPNITTVQQPSPPGRDWSKRYKAMGMLIVAGLAGGLAWAFLIEFFLDTSIKRPKEVKTKLGMPLFLSIPDTNRNGQRRRALANGNGRLQLKDAEVSPPDAIANGSPAAVKLEVAPWDPNHSLRPFYEALRDRLLGYFEARNLTHNPKLVAVTGASKGSGATTLAMGLAASLSETGEGNVLLVDMNQEHGASQHFYKGKPNCGLDDVLENETRQTALVQDNLYVVNANSNGDHLPRILPKRFASLVPKFKASDFDYIIFDMPPIGQTSITLRLAGFMDTVLLVVESEKTSRDTVLQAGSLLAETKANVNVVLNKTRSYIPARLHHEF